MPSRVGAASAKARATGAGNLNDRTKLPGGRFIGRAEREVHVSDARRVETRGSRRSRCVDAFSFEAWDGAGGRAFGRCRLSPDGGARCRSQCSWFARSTGLLAGVRQSGQVVVQAVPSVVRVAAGGPGTAARRAGAERSTCGRSESASGRRQQSCGKTHSIGRRGTPTASRTITATAPPVIRYACFTRRGRAT